MQQVRNIEEIENAISEHGEMVVGKNKKNGVIIMSMKEYKKKMLNKQIEENLVKAEEEIENGKIIEASKVFEEWNEKYGI